MLPFLLFAIIVDFGDDIDFVQSGGSLYVRSQRLVNALVEVVEAHAKRRHVFTGSQDIKGSWKTGHIWKEMFRTDRNGCHLTASGKRWHVARTNVMVLDADPVTYVALPNDAANFGQTTVVGQTAQDQFIEAAVTRKLSDQVAAVFCRGPRDVQDQLL
ncbi:hypothetical protein MTO96_037318 [Rhipicephalus appendiculatus]